MDEVRVRPLTGIEELSACVDLQMATWGAQFDDIVSAALMLVAQKIGGIAAGAFSADDDLLGIVFGLSGFRDGEPVHWSHMLAVEPAHQGRGLGALLKVYQRERVTALGIQKMYWTFEPLEARNAHFNLNRLGARIEEYVIDMYGPGETSPLHKGIGTDRFIAVWPLNARSVRSALQSDVLQWNDDRSEATAPLPFRLNEQAGTAVIDLPETGASGHGIPGPELPPQAPSFGDDSRVYIEIPPAIQSLKATRPEEARSWRTYTRAAFAHFLSRGYDVTSIARHAHTGRWFYILERAE